MTLRAANPRPRSNRDGMSGCSTRADRRTNPAAASTATTAPTRTTGAVTGVPADPYVETASIAASRADPNSAPPSTSTRCPARDRVSGMYTAVSDSSSTPTGTLTKKIHRQDQYVTKTPPMTGPMMPPMAKMLVNRPSARSRARPYWSATIPVAAGISAPPPSDCTARSATSV